jgi:dihydrofolate reductase
MTPARPIPLRDGPLRDDLPARDRAGGRSPKSTTSRMRRHAPRTAAGDRDVLVHGVRTAQLALGAGVLDELEIHQVPVLFGEGRRLFDRLGAERIELELTRVIDAPGVTHLRYRVRR